SWATWGTRAVAMGSIRADFAESKRETGWWLGSLSARWPGDQICNSLSAAEAARRSRSPFAPRRLFKVRNGVDLGRFHDLPLSSRERVHIVGIGSLLPIKRWDRLLRAAVTLKRRGLDFFIRIAGDGFLRESLRQE